MLAIGVLLICVASTLATQYKGYKVLQVVPESYEQLRFLAHLMTHDDKLDWHLEPRAVGAAATVMVSPDYLISTINVLSTHGLEPDVIIADVQELVDAEKIRLEERYRTNRAFDIDDFNSLEDIMAQLDEWVRNCPAGLSCELRDIATSYENRPLRVLTLSTGGSGKQVIWLDATTHAREWLATATALKITDHLFRNYGGDADATRILDTYDVHILHVENPDGYSHSFHVQRMWRKNRAPIPGSSCLGSDLNRNYDYMHGEEGASSDPCVDTYPGPGPASELETQGMQREVAALHNSQGIRLYITFHTYGRMILFPPGNTINHDGFNCERTADWEDLNSAANAWADTAASEIGDIDWLRGTICETIYPATGGADTWAKLVAGIKYAYTPELRGNFFIVDKEEIEPSFVQSWAGLVAMISAIEAKEG